MTEKSWKEMTGAERSAHMAAAKAAKRAAAAANPPEITEPEAQRAQAGEPNFFAPVELDDEEVLKIRAWAMAEAKKEQRQRKIDAMKAAALAEAREKMGLVVVPPEDAELARLNEMVSITIDLPEGGAPDGVRLDQRCYRHGVAYVVPRAVYETIIDIQNKAWMAEALFDGKARNYYNRMRGRFEMAYGGGTPNGSRQYHAA